MGWTFNAIFRPKKHLVLIRFYFLRKPVYSLGKITDLLYFPKKKAPYPKVVRLLCPIMWGEVIVRSGQEMLVEHLGVSVVQHRDISRRTLRSLLSPETT